MGDSVDLRRAKAWLASALGVESPFPWQLALLRRFIDGAPPRALDIPTGLGKTAVIAIWLVARACGARLPRRMVYVVDRRAVVDQATKVATDLRDVVESTPALKEALGLTTPLPISTLRGQFADNREWLADPASPAVVIGTVDMIGSRLLFEGYGVSRRMRPFHAGLLGADVLLVLDEAHLVPPFEALVASVAHERALRSDGDVIPPLRVMSLSATGRQTPDTFALTPEDEAHAVVRRRLDAKKHLVIRDAVERGSLVDTLAAEAWRLAEGTDRPLRGIVFCTRRQDAQAVAAELQKRAGDDAVELLVGGRRVHERQRASEWLGERGFLAGERATPSKSNFVVATAAGEVGVDLDADHMVCDLVEWERMVQRLGRVNRRGDGEATVIVVPVAPDAATLKAVARAAKAGEQGFDAHDGSGKDANLKPEELAVLRGQRRLEATLRTLRELRTDDVPDASPGALLALKRRAADEPPLAAQIAEATTPAPSRPALTRALVEAWSMTSLEEHAGRPEVQPWIRGWVDELPQTTIVWRRHLPVDASGKPLADADVADFLEAAPTHLLEKLEIDSGTALSWIVKRLGVLAKRAQKASQRVEQGGTASAGANAEETVSVPVLSPKHVVAFALPSSGDPVPITIDSFDVDPRAKVKLERALKSATLLVDVRLGGLRDGLLAESSEEASDVGDEEELPFRVRALTPNGPQDPDRRTWREELRVAIASDADGEVTRWLVVETDLARQPTTQEGLSAASAQQSLAAHQESARSHAHDLGTRLGLPAGYVALLELAAVLHDEGKRAQRWQRAFNAPPKSGPWAKLPNRPNQKILDGYRHELGSLPYAESDARVAALDDAARDLCLHLIASHHGHARPVIPTRSCDDAPPSALARRAQEIALRFARLERQWGPWGLAWWEAVLRAADHRASRENDERRSANG